MKKNRNTFFTESQMSATSMMPNMQMAQPQMPQQPMMQQPMQAAQASQSFYSGPNLQNVPNNVAHNNQGIMPTPIPYTGYQNSNSDIDSRLSKIERQLHRLENRITKLEGGSQFAIDSEEYNSSMYMI